ncbi:hypothetical protein OG407_49990 [Streptomyces sp. NBC_01515]|uniref:hypothetical protein n=1 Tax=Streptomyces sp. NBC_01515 TaxID=2903890 RepID=UPI00386B161B
MDSFFGVGDFIEGGCEFFVDDVSFALAVVVEDQAGEGDGEVCRDDDRSHGPPWRAAQSACKDGRKAGQEAGDG